MKSMADGLLIVGAGGLGREVYDFAVASERTVIAFIDDAVEGLAPVAAADPGAGEYVIAVGEPVTRLKIAEQLMSRGCRFASIVHPTAIIGSRVKLGAGCIVAPLAYVGPDASLGPHSVLNVHAVVGHDSHVGAYSVLSPHVAVGGNCSLGHGVFLGTHATVTPGISVGSWSKSAAGSVITRKVAPGSLLVGNPASGRVMYPIDPARM